MEVVSEYRLSQKQVSLYVCTVNLVKLATLWISTTLLLQVTSMKGFSYFVATSAPFPGASFTKLTVCMYVLCVCVFAVVIPRTYLYNCMYSSQNMSVWVSFPSHYTTVHFRLVVRKIGKSLK